MSWFDDPYGERLLRPRADDWYDTKQVCLNGHEITNYAISQPQAKRAYCESCGAKTIDACPTCAAAIRGYRHIEGVFHLNGDEPPRFCPDCGAAFPWQQAAMENLRDVLREGGISESDVQTVNEALPDIVSSTPKTDSATMRLRRVLSKLSKPAYDIAIKVTTDLASEAAKKSMGLG